MTSNAQSTFLMLRFRWVLGLFMFALVMSGITAFPLQRELERVVAIRGLDRITPADAGSGFDRWILTVRDGLRESYARYPWLAYGTDWLAFAHIIIAVFFIGPFLDPVRNVWVLRAGIIACVLVIPLALICGAIRGIPFGWRLMDCSFGVFGAIPLYYCFRLARSLEKYPANGALHTPSSSSSQAEVVVGNQVKKGEVAGIGCAIQAVGLLLIVLGFIFTFRIMIFAQLGVIAGLIFLVIGRRKAFRLICSSCGNKLTGKEVRICPVCHCHFEK